MTFDLNAAIEAAMESGSSGPHGIADKVFPAIPASEVPALAQRLLSAYVRDYLQSRRAANPVLGGIRPAPHDPAVSHRPSAKLAKRRSEWASWMRDQVHVGHGKWRQLGQCTRDDLLFAANERDTMAASNAAKADTFRDLAAKLEAHKVTTVAALPPTVLDQVRAAA